MPVIRYSVVDPEGDHINLEFFASHVGNSQHPPLADEVADAAQRPEAARSW